jgi:endonuclease/exonuclease/phosphatase family metal-dependent hydrolase
VVTLNLAREAGVERMLREFRASSALREADVLLLQEVKQEPAGRSSAEALAAAMGLHVFYAPAPGGVTDQGLAILSRYPLRDTSVHKLKRFDLGFHSRQRFALKATAQAPWGAVRIANAHLDTRLNTAERLEQLAPVVLDTAGFDGPRVIGGDFNSNGFYWLARILPIPFASQATGVRDYMTGAGYRSAAPDATTFDYLGMRLDWIWVRGLRASDSRVIPLRFSDHHAVWTRLVM